MSDKKLIVIGFLLTFALIIGGLWFFGRGEPETKNNNNQGKVIEGIAVGKSDATLLLEEFTNLRCPACAMFAENVWPKIEEQYIQTGKAKMVFFVLPPIELSRGAFCAEKQGKFKAFHDYAFKNISETISQDLVFNYANAAGLEENLFRQCFNSQEAADASASWLVQAKEKGIEYTPTLFVGGEKIVGYKSFEEIDKIISGKLK